MWGGCVFIHQPTPGLWSMKEAPQKTAAARHSDKTLQIVPLIKNLSCRNTIDSKRGRANRQPEPCTPPPAPCAHTLALSFFLSPSGVQIAPKNYAYHTSIQGWALSVVGGAAVCKPHCKWAFSFSATLPAQSLTQGGIVSERRSALELAKSLSHGVRRRRW